MTYKSEQKRKVEALIASGFFNDPGEGVYYGKPRSFVLSNPCLNLWTDIREDAIDYFDRHSIPWHRGSDREPTGHLLSSQVACVNHLYYLRQRKDLADAVVRGLGFGMTEAAILDTGFVEFEVIGKGPYLNERRWSRGATSTSVDAAMLGVQEQGERTLILIEWKYTESYGYSSLYIPERAKVYDALIMDPDSPIKVESPQHLYYEPFYQLMRQVLLGWQMARHGDYDVTGFIHVHVIPQGNDKLKAAVPSPDLPGDEMSEAWRSILNEPERYLSISPDDLLSPAACKKDSRAFFSYLSQRYDFDYNR